jgi:hypothetical protein
MTTVLQLELKHYIDNHGFETELQDNGVVLYIPVTRFVDNGLGNRFLSNEAHYVETFRQARNALGY